MASIKKQSSGRYQARYGDATGREHAQRFDLKKDAQAWLDGVTSAVHTGTYVDPKAGRSTVGALAPVWLQVKAGRVKPKTYVGYVSLLEVQVLPRWRDVPVSAHHVGYRGVGVGPHCRRSLSVADPPGLHGAQGRPGHRCKGPQPCGDSCPGGRVATDAAESASVLDDG